MRKEDKTLLYLKLPTPNRWAAITDFVIKKYPQKFPLPKLNILSFGKEYKQLQNKAREYYLEHKEEVEKELHQSAVQEFEQLIDEYNNAKNKLKQAKALLEKINYFYVDNEEIDFEKSIIEDIVSLFLK